MNPFHDDRSTDLLSRVSDDIALLRQDVGNLLSHTAKRTVPAGMRDIAGAARNRLEAGRQYSAEHLRALRDQVNQPAAAWVGGALVVGLIAAGIYWFCKDGCCCTERLEEADEDI